MNSVTVQYLYAQERKNNRFNTCKINEMYHHDRGYQPRMKTLAMLLFFASPLASLFRLGILLYDHYFLSPLDDQQQQEQQKSPLIEFVSSSHSSSGTRTENHSNTPSIHDLPQFLKMLQNATTIDEMVQAILSSSFPPLNFLVGLSPSPSIMFASTTTTTSNPIHKIMTHSSTSKYGPYPYNMQLHVVHADLQAVLPFLFVSFILVWVPLVLFFIPRRRRWTHLNEYQNYPGQRSQRRDGSRRQFEIGLKIQELLHCLEGYRMVSWCVAMNEVH